MPTLICRSGPLAGQRFEFDSEAVIGREDATVAVADEEASRRHAAIRVVGTDVAIEDLGSTNGTFVDGRRIEDLTTLHGGETIRIGQSTFLLERAPAGDPGATRVASIPDRGATAIRPRPPVPAGPPSPAPAAGAPPAPRPAPEPATAPETPAAVPPPPPARRPAPALAGATAGPAIDAPFARFAPTAPVRRHGIASRKAAPSLVSAATIIATAGALIAYFAGR